MTTAPPLPSAAAGLLDDLIAVLMVEPLGEADAADPGRVLRRPTGSRDRLIHWALGRPAGAVSSAGRIHVNLASALRVRAR